MRVAGVRPRLQSDICTTRRADTECGMGLIEMSVEQESKMLVLDCLLDHNCSFSGSCSSSVNQDTEECESCRMPFNFVRTSKVRQCPQF